MSDEIPQFLKTDDEQKESVSRSRSHSGYRSERREWGWFIIAGLVLLAGIAGIWGWTRRRGSEPIASPTPSPIALFTSPPVFSPTPSPEPPPKDSYEIEILNGSGRPGEAGAIRAVLEKLGYKIGDAGNADSYDYTSTLIRSRANVETAYLDALADVLKGEFTKVSRETDEDASSQVVVITGGTRLGATPEPTEVPTSTPEATSSAE